MKKLFNLILFIVLSGVLFDFIANLFKKATDLSIGCGILLIFGYLIVVCFIIKPKREK